jgi:hypothetical protein
MRVSLTGMDSGADDRGLSAGEVVVGVNRLLENFRGHSSG